MDKIDKLLHIGMATCALVLVLILMMAQDEYERFMLNCEAASFECIELWEMEQRND